MDEKGLGQAKKWLVGWKRRGAIAAVINPKSHHIREPHGLGGPKT